MPNNIAIQGRDVLQETVSLLQGLEFSTQDGITVSGDNVRLVLTPKWNGIDAYRLLLTCFVCGDQKVEWAGMPVRLSSTIDTNSPVFFFRVNARGQAILDGIPSGEYRMSAMMTFCGTGKVPVSLPQGDLEQLAASSEHEREKWPEPLINLVSNDERLIAVPQYDDYGHMSITFETRDKALAYGNVRFAVIDSAGLAQMNSEIVLEKSEHQGVWIATWHGDIDTKASTTLVFDIEPAV